MKAETSLSAVELSGKVKKRGFLLKQVNNNVDTLFEGKHGAVARW